MGRQSDDDDKNIPDMSSLKVAAIQMHEMYTSFKDAGFTERQALELTVKITLGSM